MGGQMKKRSIAELEEAVKKKLSEADVVNNLDTYSNADALSAEQGAILREMIESMIHKLVTEGSIAIKVEKTFIIDASSLAHDETEGRAIIINETSQIKL